MAATKTISPLGIQYFDENGNPLSGGFIYCFAAGTETHEPVYADAAGTTELPQPVELDGEGRAVYFLSPTTYHFVIKDQNGADVTGGDIDNVTALQGVGGSSGVDVAVIAGEDLSSNQLVYGSDGVGGTTASRFYKADADALLTAFLPTIVGFTTGVIDTGTSGFIRKDGTLDGFVGLTPGATYYASSVAGDITAAPSAGKARIVGFALNGTTLLLSLGHTPNYAASVCDGCLTLTSGVPVTTADVLAAGTVYFTQRTGDRVGLYDVAYGWRLFVFPELSTPVSATVNKLFDVFLYNNAGVPALEQLAWTSDLVRATALAAQDGVLVKAGDPTRRWVGTYRTTAVANQTEDSFARRLLSSYPHRGRRPLRKGDSTDSWTYTTGAFRQANGSAANQVDCVIGLADALLELEAIAMATNTNAGVGLAIGIGEDAVAALAPTLKTQITVAAANAIVMLRASLRRYPAVGYHFYPALELSTAVGTTTWYGDAADATSVQTGIQGSIDG